MWDRVAERWGADWSRELHLKRVSTGLTGTIGSNGPVRSFGCVAEKFAGPAVEDAGGELDFQKTVPVRQCRLNAASLEAGLRPEGLFR